MIFSLGPFFFFQLNVEIKLYVFKSHLKKKTKKKKKSQRAVTVTMFSGSIFHKPHPHETVMCLPSVKESVHTMLFMATGC